MSEPVIHVSALTRRFGGAAAAAKRLPALWRSLGADAGRAFRAYVAGQPFPGDHAADARACARANLRPPPSRTCSRFASVRDGRCESAAPAAGCSSGRESPDVPDLWRSRGSEARGPTVRIGRRWDNDDVLFYLQAGPVMLAVVHLTYSGRIPDPDARFRTPSFTRLGANGLTSAWRLTRTSGALMDRRDALRTLQTR